jgi:glutamate-ammonia-ligase adenylyltransferase
LEALRRLQIVPEAEYAVLHDGYIFLRRLIDALRVVRGDASDLVLPPTGSEELKSLARRLGYRELDRRSAALGLAADVDQWMKTVHGAFTARFGR